MSTEAIIATAKAVILAANAGMYPQDLMVLQNNKKTWNDASMGCPKPDMTYAQMQTKGYETIITDGVVRYEVHGNKNGYAVLCKTSPLSNKEAKTYDQNRTKQKNITKNNQ